VIYKFKSKGSVIQRLGLAVMEEM